MRAMTAIALIALLAGGCAEVSDQTNDIDDETQLADGELSFGDNTVLATIPQENGSVLRFVELAPGEVAVLEVAPITTGNCNDTNFRGWINAFGYNDRGTPDFRLNQVAETSGFFEHYDYAPGNGQSYDFYRYVVGGGEGSIWYAVDRYASRVAVCNIGTSEPGNPGGAAHPAISYQGYNNPHMGPVVRMMYRKPGQVVWQQAASKDFAPGEVGQTLSWHFYTALNWDWRTDIYWAGADDSFDIGHALEDL